MGENFTKAILLIISALYFPAAWAQQEISGKVTGADDNLPIPGVNVLEKGTKRGTVTDASGAYKTEVSNNSALVFSAVGYLKKEVQVSGQSVIDVKLESDVNQLDEIVVTALGQTEEKRALGYSLQEVKSEAIKSSGEQNLVGALQGKIAGAIITGSGGAPGGGVNIILRGITSLSGGADNQPLFVVDGIIISNSTVGGSSSPSAGSNSADVSEQFANTNRAADINPDDVESISVLKGPAATALYGLRASNGAILITTKRGKSGKLRVNVSSSFGVDHVNKTPRFQNRFIQGQQGEFISETGPKSIFRSFGPALGNEANPNDKIYDNMRDFYVIGTRTAYNISISKGGEKGNIYFSFGRNYQKGIVPYTDFGRTSLKLAGLYNVSKKFSISGSVNYVNSGGKRPPAGDKSIFSSISYWPNSYDVNDYVKPDGTQKNITKGVVDNPKYLAEKSPRIDRVNRYIADMTFHYDFNSWLSAKYQVTFDAFQETRRRAVDSAFDVGVQVKGFLIKDYLNYREINSNFYLTAKKSFNENWNGALMAGNSAVDSQKPDSYYTRGERLQKGSDPNEISSYSNTETRFYSPGQYRIISFFGDARLSYKEVLYFNVTGRNDLVSTLPVKSNSFFYPSVSLGYIFTENLPKNNLLSYGKLRVSWAQVGKGTDPYITSSYYAPVANFPYNGTVPGYSRVAVAADPNLKPERTTSVETGAELRFLKNRLGADLTYFTMDSKDQIVKAPVTNASGYADYYTNIGLVRNQGIELLITGKPVQSKNFSWDISVNWSKLAGKVIEMPPALQEIVYFDNAKTFLKVRQGSHIGDLWGFEYMKSPDGQTIIQANGFPSVNTAAAVKAGNALPDWQGGLTNTFTFKSLSLSCLFEWRRGGHAVDMAEENSVRNGLTGFTERRYEQVVYKGVTAQQNADGSTSYIPNTKQVQLDDAFYRSPNQFYYWSGFTIQDASWFRLRSLSISYSLPKKLMAKTAFKGEVRFSLTATNLFLNTPFRGYDPEALSFGSGTNRIGFVGRNNPSTRSFQMGVSMGF